MTRVKICGLADLSDAWRAVEAGADALGFVFEPSSPRCVLGRDLSGLTELPPFVVRVAVFGPFRGLPDARLFDVVQCLDTKSVQGVRSVLPVIRLAEGQRPEDVPTPSARAVVLDAHVHGQFGGGGQPIDWGLAAELVARWPEVKVVLAGGLNPANVAEAVRRVRPYAVDVSSGVEAGPGRKDPDAVRRFVEAAKSA